MDRSMGITRTTHLLTEVDGLALASPHRVIKHSAQPVAELLGGTEEV